MKKTVAKPPRMTPDEKRIAREMDFDRGMPPVAVAEALGRGLSSICRFLAQKKAPKPSGGQRKLTETMIDKTVTTLELMVDEADAEREVTLPMVMRRCRLKVCERTVAKALHARGYWFRKLRHKMILTPDDVNARHAWAKKYKNMPREWWQKKIQIHLDNHCFKVATTSKGRKLLAKRRVRGVYRKKQKSLRSGHVKPSPGLRTDTGAKGILKIGGVGKGKVLVWKTIHGSWGGDLAATAYKDWVSPALKASFPGRSSFTILEDNDPTGNLSKKGKAAKAAKNLTVSGLVVV